ncbi:MAG: right-handed parallel beta-helix repeat-containing protein [Eubacteriales bacterium]
MIPYNKIASLEVSPNGRSLSSALSFAAELRRSGVGQPITIRMADGIYPITQPISVTPDVTNITVEALSAGKTVLSGGERVTGFERAKFVRPDGSEIDCLCASVERTDFTDVYVNGLRAAHSRYPASGSLAFEEVENKSGELFAASSWVKFKAEDIAPLSARSIGGATLSYLHLWIDEHTEISSYDPQTRTAVMRRLSRFNMVNNALYYFEDVPETFGLENEYYLDRENKLLYYVPREGIDADNIELYIPSASALVNICGRSAELPVENIRFRGITFANTRGDYEAALETSGERGDKPVIYASDAQGVSNAAGVVNIRYASHIAFDDCKFTNYGLYGIDIRSGSSEIAVRGCDFNDGGAGGVKVNGGAALSDKPNHTHNVYIENNVIERCGRRHMAACGVMLMHAYDCRVSHNTIRDLFYTGISGGWVWGYSPSVSHGNLIEYNHIYNIGQGVLSDMGGVYLLGAQPGTVVRRNLIHDIKSRDYGGWALYTDEGSGYVTLEENICYNTSDNCYHQHYGRMNTVRNNIFAFAGKEIMRITRFEGHLSIIFENNIILTDGCPVYGVSDEHLACGTMACSGNLIWQTGGGAPVMAKNGDKSYTFEDFRALGAEEGSAVANPIFCDAENGDFRLCQCSPALKMGIKRINLADAGARR